VTRKGIRKFVRMPFGHKKVPVVLQALIQNILHDLIYCVCFLYIDDLIMYGKDEQECIDNTKRVLEMIYEDNLKCSGLRCEFCCVELRFLHVIEDGQLFLKVDKL
jgi:hypothetical protein